MNQKITMRRFLFFLTGLLIISASITYVLARLPNKPEELLLLWGKQHDGQCLVQVVNPLTATPASLLIGEPDCLYDTVTIEGEQHLAHFNREQSEITIYQIGEMYMLQVEMVISLEQMAFWNGSDITWESEETLYIGGVVDGKQQIFKVDVKSETRTLFIENTQGFAFRPTISPNGAYMTYIAIDGLETSHQCQLSCYYHYHLFHIDTQTSFDLLVLSDEIGIDNRFDHCKQRWSPDNRFLAVQVSCTGASDYGSIFVFDTYSNELVHVKGQRDSGVYLHAWLSSSELVYTDFFGFPDNNLRLNPMTVFDLTTMTSYPFIDFSTLNNDGVVWDIQISGWTQDGNYIVGTMATVDGGTLVIIDQSGEEQELTFVERKAYFSDPLWSPSGDWIAVRIRDDVEEVSGVQFVNRAGDQVVNTDLVYKQYEVQYAWFTR